LYCRQQGLCCALCCSTVKHQKFTTVTIGPGAHTSLRRDAKHFFLSHIVQMAPERCLGPEQRVWGGMRGNGYTNCLLHMWSKVLRS
jgi:hypothetical protein